MFDAFEVSLELVRALRTPCAVIRRADPKLYTQIRAAATSIPLNLAEGRRRSGKDRKHLWRVAAGSAAEVRAALLTAEAWGDLQPRHAGQSLALIDRVLAMTWAMTR